MAKLTYTAYARLASGQSRSREFSSSKNAIRHAREVANERGSCFVVSSGDEVIFNTHNTLEDALTLGGKNPVVQS